MKVAFLSDVHGNAVALEAVLADIQLKAIDKVVVLGDLAYRGPEPGRAIQLIRDLHADVVKGNADEWLVRGIVPGEVQDGALERMNLEREWAIERLVDDDLAYLRGLPEQIQLHLSPSVFVHAFHATPGSLFDIVAPDASAVDLRSQLTQTVNADLYMYAHIHHPYVRYVDGKCIANTGSVGLPFDGMAKASYVIVEAEEDRFTVTIQRVAYDVERVIRLYEVGDYPNRETMKRVVRYGVKPA